MIKKLLSVALIATSFAALTPAFAEDGDGNNVKYMSKKMYSPMHKGKKVNIQVMTMKDGSVWAMMPYADLQHISDVPLDKTGNE